MFRKLAIVAATLTALAGGAAAQNRPPIRILVGLQPGATTDTMARLLAGKLTDILKEPVVVDTKPGAGQRIAMQELLKVPANGRTMLLASSSVYSILPHIYGDQTGYDPFRDTTPITRLVIFQVGIAAGNKTGITSIKDLIAWARKNPDRVSFASPGAGTSSHFTGVLLSKALGIPMTHVAYRGTALALGELMSGRVPLVFTAYSDLPELANAGKLRIIATAGPKRSPATPDVPTLKEQGVDIAFDSAFDMHARAGTPPDAIRKLNTAVVAALKDPDVSAKLNALGLQPVGSTPDELLRSQQAEYKLWAAPVKESGYKGE